MVRTMGVNIQSVWTAMSKRRRIIVMVAASLIILMGAIMAGEAPSFLEWLGGFISLSVLILTPIGVAFAIKSTFQMGPLTRSKPTEPKAAPDVSPADKVRAEGDFLRSLGDQAREAPVESSDRPRKPVSTLFPPAPVKETATFPDQRSDLGKEIGYAEDGSELTFEYADVYGEVSVRTVSHWIEHRHHVRGWCTDQNAHRTFRKDRVLGWIDGAEELQRR